ncbi:MAG: helix-hairpin-helix domain-containing protein [Candidatus Heimdallarchaeaceae archaeon]
MSVQKRPKRLIGSSRYSIALEPKTTEFSPTMTGKVHFYDGKHIVKVQPYSSFDQLAKSIYHFWEDTIIGQLNQRRFAFWFSEFLEDFNISNVDYDKLQEELRALNTGVSLQPVGVPIKEAKVVYAEPTKLTPTPQKKADYKAILSPTGVPVREAKVVYDEPVIREEPRKTKVQESFILGETAADVRARLKPTGVPIKEAKVMKETSEESRTPRRELHPVGTYKDMRQIEGSSVPTDKIVKHRVKEDVLPLPSRKTREVPVDSLHKPSELLSSLQTKAPEVKTLPPLKREKVRPPPPEKRLLKPSEVLKERETIFNDERKFPRSLDTETPSESDRLLKPSEYLGQKEIITGTTEPTRQDKPLKTEKPKKEELESIPAPKRIVEEAIPEPTKIGEEIKKEYSLEDVNGIGATKAQLLRDAGIKTVQQLANIKVEELTKIKGIGPSTAAKYIKNAKDLLNS